MPSLYFEDFAPGLTREVGSRTVSEEDIVRFAREYDPQPFHVDASAAAESQYGGLIASGWHTCSVLMRLMCDGLLIDAAGMGSPGVDELRWPAPVRAGDTLTGRFTVADARPSRSKPDRGMVWLLWEALNQRGDIVLSLRCIVLFKRRSQA